MITADIHTHTYFSGDSKESMENQILSAISKNISTLCFTEHMDMDFPKNGVDPDDMFTLDTDAYLHEFQIMQDKYSSKIKLLFGVELGLQPHLADTHKEYVRKYPFDYIIGSEHTTNRKDPYYPAFYEGRTEYEAYCEYFEDICCNIKAFSDFNSFGHLDYVVRYGPNKNQEYCYSRYGDYIDAILKLLIDKGIGLEANTGGYKYGLGEPNPSKDILLRYKELGGELLTIGSDSHDVNRIAADFDRLEALLVDCGYKYYTYFEKRKPVFLKF